MNKKEFKDEAKIDNFEKIRKLFVNQLEELGVSPSVLMNFEIVLEELFVNICHYAYKDSGPVEGICTVDDNKIELTLKDQGQPFDPFQRENPDLKKPLEERPIGGLGIFMVKQNADSYEYDYIDGSNVVHLTFDL